MRALGLTIGVGVMLCAQPALAQNYAGCTKVERGIIVAAMDRSKRLALTAATAIGPTPVFTRWFGKYNTKSAEIVRRNVKSIVGAIRTGAVTTECVNVGVGLCDKDTYAFVNSDSHYLVNLCPKFFEMPTMKDLDDFEISEGNGTRAGTIIHEISHFTIVAATEDICYARDVCAEMAIDAPLDAIMNADSYQYFVEDVTYYGVAGE
jgi:peptidyl-Lys metalloendopeptidase